MVDQNNTIEKKLVSTDIVYQETMNELRHHRNMELNTANWNTVIMLAIIGGEITIKTELVKGSLSFITPKIFGNLEVLIALVIIILTFSSLYSIYYSHDRYVLLREYTRDNFHQDVHSTGLEYVERHEKKIYKGLKQYIFLMVGSGLLGVTAFVFLLI